MKRFQSILLTLALVVLATSLTSAPATAQKGAPEKPSSFGAAPSPTVDSTDSKSLLAECDRRLEACKLDAVGVPFLAGAYMAIWVILLAFLFMVRRGQLRLRAEVEELEARLAALGGADP